MTFLETDDVLEKNKLHLEHGVNSFLVVFSWRFCSKGRQSWCGEHGCNVDTAVFPASLNGILMVSQLNLVYIMVFKSLLC